jgi:hypothetical protein
LVATAQAVVQTVMAMHMYKFWTQMATYGVLVTMAMANLV